MRKERRGLALVGRGSGCPCPVAGHSLRPSRPSLVRSCLRSGIHASAGQRRRLSGHGHPDLNIERGLDSGRVGSGGAIHAGLMWANPHQACRTGLPRRVFLRERRARQGCRAVFSTNLGFVLNTTSKNGHGGRFCAKESSYSRIPVKPPST